jgi:hypothetical protein
MQQLPSKENIFVPLFREMHLSSEEAKAVPEEKSETTKEFSRQIIFSSQTLTVPN